MVTYLFTKIDSVHVLGEGLVELFNSLTFFMLSGNPLHCNCELRWLRHWLTSDAQAAAKVLDSADVLCVSPSTVTGRTPSNTPPFFPLPISRTATILTRGPSSG